MATYTVKQGDSIASIAYDHGLFPDTIWNHPENSELKQKRKNPNVLFPGDPVYIPEKKQKEEPCATEQKHRFRRKGVPAILKIQLQEDGEPRAYLKYTIELDGHLIEGKTDGDGFLKHALPPGAMRGIIYIGEEEKIPLWIGHLDPVTEITGIQQRLNNLGFGAGDSGQLDEDTKDAIRAFQEKYGLEATGSPDKDTQAKLVEIHGC